MLLFQSQFRSRLGTRSCFDLAAGFFSYHYGLTAPTTATKMKRHRHVVTHVVCALCDCFFTPHACSHGYDLTTPTEATIVSETVSCNTCGPLDYTFLRLGYPKNHRRISRGTLAQKNQKKTQLVFFVRKPVDAETDHVAAVMSCWHLLCRTLEPRSCKTSKLLAFINFFLGLCIFFWASAFDILFLNESVQLSRKSLVSQWRPSPFTPYRWRLSWRRHSFVDMHAKNGWRFETLHFMFTLAAFVPYIFRLTTCVFAVLHVTGQPLCKGSCRFGW